MVFCDLILPMDNITKLSQALHQAILKLLKPLVRILLNHGVSVNEFMDIAKEAYVDVAEQEFQIQGRKQSTSRIAVLTGMHRKDVSRYLNKIKAPESNESQFHNRAAKVMTAWKNEAEFCDEQGNPLMLPIEGDTRSFTALVSKHSGSMTMRSMLDEMVRVKVVKIDEQGFVHLVNEVYVPQDSDPQRLAYMGEACADLLNTLSVNIEKPEANRLQLTTAFDNLPEESIPAFRVYSQKQTAKLIKNLESWLSKHDRDSNPEVVGSGRIRAGLGIYYIENEFMNENES